MPDHETRQARRARERREEKEAANADGLWDRPITIAGADLLARQHGYRFVGFIDPMTVPTLRAAVQGVAFTAPGPRYMAAFMPEPDDGGEAVFADGRTANRALRRGLERCRQLRSEAPESKNAGMAEHG